MDRLKEIERNCTAWKGHIERLEKQLLGFHVSSIQRSYVDDVSFLLDKVKKYEEDFAQIKYEYEQSLDEQSDYRMYKIAVEALKD